MHSVCRMPQSICTSFIFSQQPKCNTCNELAKCLRDLATQTTNERNTHIAAQVRLVGTNIELQLRRTRQSRELRQESKRLERCRRENARMRDMLAYLLAGDQHQKGRMKDNETREERKMEVVRDLECASALLQLGDTRDPVQPV